MFIIRKTRAGKANRKAMQRNASEIKDVRNYQLFLTSRRTTASVVKQLLSDITQFFGGLCPISGPNIQA